MKIHMLITLSPSNLTEDPFQSGYPGACRKWNTSTKQVKARGCHTSVGLLDENPEWLWFMNMQHVCVLALVSGAQQMAGVFGTCYTP